MTVTLAAKPTLTGKQVILRPVGPQDVPDLAEAVQDLETSRLTGSRGDYDLALIQQWYATRHEHDDRLDLAIVARDSGRCAGEVVLNELDRPNRACNLRIMITPGQVGRGLGSEAIALLLEHAFDTVGLHRISLEVYDFNPRARHVYDKLGFVAEGVLRDALYWDGEWVDATVMSALSTDPRPPR